MGERFVAKFSWARPTTLRLAREIGVLTARTAGAVAARGRRRQRRPLLLITRRVPGRPCSRSSVACQRDARGRNPSGWFRDGGRRQSTRSTGIVQADSSRASWRAQHQPTARERAEAPPSASSPGAAPQTTTKYPARPVRELGPAGSAPGVTRWCEWATPRWPVPPETLRPPLPGQQAAALQRSSMALTCLPQTRRQPCIASGD